MIDLTFNDFIVAAQNSNPDDHLVVHDNGTIGKKYTYAEPSEAVNRRTWRAFERAINEIFTEKRRNLISERYGGADWWRKMTQSSLPFKRRYVEYFGLGASISYTYNLGEAEARGGYLSSVTNYSIEEVNRFFQSATQHGYLGEREDPKAMAGSPKQTHEHLTRDYYLMDRQRAMLSQGLEKLISHDSEIPWNHPYYSRLTMGIVNMIETQKNASGDRRDLGLIIPAPTGVEGEMDYYYVHDIISYKGLSAFALAPVSKQSSLPPILTFRCTIQAPSQGDFYRSIENDAEPRPGESGWKANELAFEQLMNDETFTRGQKIVVTGYSLGGAHSGHFLRKYWKQVKEFVGFNFLGNDKEVIQDLANQINTLPEQAVPPAFYLHRNIGDWVPKAGDMRVGWGIKHPNAICKEYRWEIHDKDKPTNEFSSENGHKSFSLHSVRPMEFLDENKYPYELNTGQLKRDKALKGDKIIEQHRQNYGVGLFYRYGKKLWSMFSFILRLFGLENWLGENRR